MTVEDHKDRFPEGMRVLAVDDDPTCLKFLEGLLRKCKYHVTTTNQAIKALEMLRGNRDKYDLVISDVNMPDMDGFKLLELLGLEMDLPVIMLSGYSNTELVMKGISHGACDYLLKPVRIEELKNIWQHVVRKKKIEPKDQSKSSNQDKASSGAGEDVQGISPTGSSERSGKLSRKRKDQNEDEEVEGEDNEHENDDPSTQKKQRIVWDVDLHRKFVAAVNQLGYEKAVPKKILDLMDVEGLSRENVASHLQKYRLYLKRIRLWQPNLFPSLGGRESSYTRMGVLDKFADLHSNRSGRFSNTALSSYAHGAYRRLNSSACLSTGGITSSGLVQPGPFQNLSNYTNNFGKLQPNNSANQSPTLFGSTPASLELNRLQQSKLTTHIGESFPKYTASSRFQDSRLASSSLPSGSIFPSSSLMLQGNGQQTQNAGVFGSLSSNNFLDYNQCSESLQDGGQQSRFQSNALALSEPFNDGALHGNLGVSSSGPQIGNTLNDFPSVRALPTPVCELRGNVQNQEGLIGDVVPPMDYTAEQRWEEHKVDYNPNLNQTFSAISSLGTANCVDGLESQSVDQNGSVCNNEMSPLMKPIEDYFLEQTKPHDDFFDNESLNDIMSTVTKREQNEHMLLDAEFGFDAYSLGSCI